jgi:hypothetical protein
MHIAGIFGPKLSGKSTLARKLSEQYWVQEKRRSFVLDPNLENWGPQCWVTDNEELFAQTVWNVRNELVIIEEAAATINRDRGKVAGYFTRIRHAGHKVIVVGHSGCDLLPVMRQQIDEIFLFRQPQQAAEVWAHNFADERILACTKLKQFEFLHSRLYGDPKIKILKL